MLMAASMVVLGWSASPAWAQLCPHAELVGPDPSLLAQVRYYLAEHPQTSSSTTARCLRVVVELRPDHGAVRMLIRQGLVHPKERVVRSPRTAASLIASWTAEPLQDLAWDALTAQIPAAPNAGRPSGAESSSTASARSQTADGALTDAARSSRGETLAPGGSPPTAAVPVPSPPIVEGGGPGGDAEGGVEARRIAVRPAGARDGYHWWFAALGATSDGGSWGGGFELAWETGPPGWRIGPSLRFQVEEQPGGALRAGARAYEGAVGVQGGKAWWLGPTRMGLRLGVTAAYRYVDPNMPVGRIFCAPIEPCTIGDIPPPDAPPFHAVTAWAEAGLAFDVALSESLAVGAMVSAAGTPGFVTIDAPDVAPPEGDGDRVRQLPGLPRWRALLRVGAWWGS